MNRNTNNSSSHYISSDDDDDYANAAEEEDSDTGSFFDELVEEDDHANVVNDVPIGDDEEGSYIEEEYGDDDEAVDHEIELDEEGSFIDEEEEYEDDNGSFYDDDDDDKEGLAVVDDDNDQDFRDDNDADEEDGSFIEEEIIDDDDDMEDHHHHHVHRQEPPSSPTHSQRNQQRRPSLSLSSSPFQRPISPRRNEGSSKTNRYSNNDTTNSSNHTNSTNRNTVGSGEGEEEDGTNTYMTNDDDVSPTNAITLSSPRISVDMREPQQKLRVQEQLQYQALLETTTTTTISNGGGAGGYNYGGEDSKPDEEEPCYSNRHRTQRQQPQQLSDEQHHPLDDDIMERSDKNRYNHGRRDNTAMDDHDDDDDADYFSDDNDDDDQSYQSGQSQYDDDNDNEDDMDKPQRQEEEDHQQQFYDDDDEELDDGIDEEYDDNHHQRDEYGDEYDDQLDHDGQESYASSKRDHDPQLYNDDDEQASYESGMSNHNNDPEEEGDDNDYQSDADDDDYVSNDGEGSNESQTYDNEQQPPPVYNQPQKPVVESQLYRNDPQQQQPDDEEEEVYDGSDIDDNDSYQSGSDSNNHMTYNNEEYDDEDNDQIEDRNIVNKQYTNDITDEQAHRIYDNNQNYTGQNAKYADNFSDGDDDNESYISEDASRQSHDDEYEPEENDMQLQQQQYNNNNEDDATFISTTIGPPPFVEDETTTEDYVENEDDMVREYDKNYLVSDDDDEDVDNTGDDDDGNDDDNTIHSGNSNVERSDPSGSDAGDHSSDDASINDSDGDEPDVATIYQQMDAPSYHTLRSDKPMEASHHSSLGQLSNGSKSNTRRNSLVDTDFSAFSNKSSTMATKDPRVGSTHSRKSYDDKARLGSTTTMRKSDLDQNNDGLFIVNTSNRGAQSRFFYGERRQLSNDFSVDMQNFGSDYDNIVDTSQNEESQSDDPAKEAQSRPQRKIGVVRHDSTDSASFFRAPNKYISSNSNDAVKSESVRSNQSNLSGSTHASAKFESAGERSFSFVGSDEDSDSIDLNDDGFEHEMSDHTPGSKAIQSVSTNASSTEQKEVHSQFNILRQVALEAATPDEIKAGTKDGALVEHSSKNSSIQNEAVEKSAAISSRNVPYTQLNDALKNAGAEYQVHNVFVDESMKPIGQETDSHFLRKDSVDVDPKTRQTKILGHESVLAGTAENKIGRCVVENVSRREIDESVSSSTSSNANLNSKQYWKERSRVSGSNSGLNHASNAQESTYLAANTRPQQFMPAISVVDTKPTLSHPWIPASETKPVTPLLTNISSSSDDIDVKNMKDIETGLHAQDYKTAKDSDDSDEGKEQAPKRSRRKKRPKWMYGAIGIFILFVLMLMIVLLTKRKKDSASPNLPPISSPDLMPTSSPVGVQIPTTSIPNVPGAPTSQLIHFVLQATLLASSNVSSGFGSSVAIDNDIVLVGEPGTDRIKSFNAQAEEWVEMSRIMFSPVGSQFGKTVDLVNQITVIGAPSMDTADTNSSIGGVFVYSYDLAQQTWQEPGSSLMGDDDLSTSSGEEFGFAVALSYDRQVIVGAPKNSRGGVDAGRVYTFKYQQSSTSWASNELFALVGEQADDLFGTSVAISRDGTRFVAGAPGMNGYVRIYFWIDTRWQLLSVVRGENENEHCGSSVQMLSDVGDYIAIGCPGFDNGTGRVIVYHQQLSSGRYEPLGSGIVGNPGDGIGFRSGMTGDVTTTNDPIVIVATSYGKVLRYDFNRITNSWAQLYSDISIPVPDQISLAFTSGELTDTLVIGVSGSNEKALIYTTGSIASTTMMPEITASVPTMTPQSLATNTISPTVSSMFSPIDSPTTTVTPTVSFLAPETTFAPIPYTSIETTPPTTNTPSFVSVPMPIASAPVNIDMAWTNVGGPFQFDTSTSSVPITSVALADTRMIMGSSTLASVQSFFRQTITIIAVWETKPYQTLYGSSIGGGDGDEYGAAMDTVDDLLIVGAPGSIGGGGSVYCYRIDTTTGDWASYGSLVQSSTLQSTEERFGSSVSISSPGSGTVQQPARMAVGAPNHNSADNGLIGRGRVVIYEYDPSILDWKMMEEIMGMESGEQFGTAMDMSSTGRFIIVGGPGSRGGIGLATIYQYSSLLWLAVTTVSGEESGSTEQFGSSVRMLSDDGFIVAVGGPNYDTNRGRVVVYERNLLTGQYNMVGIPIIGEMNERIGLPNAISGSSNLSKTILKVIVRTANGYVKLYEYNKISSTTWTASVIVVAPSSNTNESVILAATSDSSSIVVVGTENSNGISAAVYNE